MARLTLPEFADRITEIMPVVMKEFVKHLSASFYKTKITLAQFVILDFISKQAEPNMSDIAHAMNVTTAAMTGLIDRFVRDGYVIRLNDPKDRRIVKVRLTRRGAAIIKDVMRRRRQVIINIFGKISQKERQDYLNILTHIRDHLR